MIQTLEAILLGAVQGISEFFPISSTGHLILLENLLGLSQEKFGLAFDAALHLGTAAAVIYYFRNRWPKIIKEKLGFYLLIATVPAAIIGVAFETKIETLFRSSLLVAYALIVGALILYLAEKIGKKTKQIDAVNLQNSIIIGFSQAMALVPGISRSGITISMAMFLGLTRSAAAEFTFLLSAPIVLGAGGLKFLKVLKLFAAGNMNFSDFGFFIVGMVASAIFGFLAIKYLLIFLKKSSLNVFVIYRIILALIVITFVTYAC